MLAVPLLIVAEPMISLLRVRVAKAPLPLVALTVKLVALLLMLEACDTFMSVGTALRSVRQGSP